MCSSFKLSSEDTRDHTLYYFPGFSAYLNKNAVREHDEINVIVKNIKSLGRNKNDS